MNQEAKRNRINAADFVEILLILFVTVSCIYPPLTTFGNNTLLCTLCLIFWMIIALFRHRNFFLLITSANLCIIVFSVLSVAVPYIFSNSTYGNRYLALIPMIFFSLIFDYYKKTNRLSIPIRIAYITLLFAAVTWIRTTIALLENPWISRSIKSAGEYSTNLSKQGIGGYSFIYFLTLVICLLAYMYTTSQKLLHRIFISLLLLACAATIILSNYFTALLLAVLGALLIFAQHLLTRQSKITIVLLGLPLLLIFLFWKPILIAICSTLIRFLGEGKTLSRLQEIVDFLENGTRLDLLFDRFPLILESIQVTLAHPLLGISTQPIQYSGDYIIGFGQHSHIMDTFALLGIPLGLLYIKAALVPFKDDQTEDTFWTNNSIKLIFVTLLVMDTATNSLGFCIGFLYPAIKEIKRMNAGHRTDIRHSLAEQHAAISRPANSLAKKPR